MDLKRMKTIILILTLSLAFVFPVQADELHFILNGKAIHLDGGNYNESNWGYGLEYDFEQRNNWITFINGSSFKDSNNQTSRYLGAGMKRRYLLQKDPEGWHVDAGLIAFFMTRKDYRDNDPFPGVLPFVSIGTPSYALNITYIPEVSPKHKALFYFQATFRLAEF